MTSNNIKSFRSRRDKVLQLCSDIVIDINVLYLICLNQCYLENDLHLVIMCLIIMGSVADTPKVPGR